jgi:hypothetical protein
VEEPRRATPIVPPGFSAPVEPNPIVKAHPPQARLRNVSSPIIPVIPIRPVAPSVLPASPDRTKEENKVIEASDSSNVDLSVVPGIPSTPIASAKPSRNISAKPQAVVASPKRKSGEALVVKQNGDKQATTASPLKVTPKGKTAGGKRGPNPVEASPQKEVSDRTPATTPASSKRQHPGKLDIAAATKIPENEQSVSTSSTRPESQPRAVRAMSTAVAQSVPGSPAGISTGSPIKRSTGAKTLRVIATPKTETPPPLSGVPIR